MASIMPDTQPNQGESTSEHHHVHSHGHHGHHGHPHEHQEHSSFAEANRHYYNETAQQYNDRPDAQERASQLGAAMLKAYPFNENTTVVMDFACGTGLISKGLAAHVKSIVGVDISQSMVDHYNRSVSNQGIPPEEMRAVCVAELRENEKQLDGMTFDVIVCASAYHHFSSIEEVTTTLVSYLKPGGSLLVTDLMKSESLHEIFPHDVRHIVAHKGGFAEEEIRTVFENAGLGNFTFAKVADARHSGHPVSLFLARGDKCAQTVL